MVCGSWLTGLRRRLVRTVAKRRIVAARRSATVVERLEVRTLPAVITVNSLADDLIAGDSLVTLREAVAAANSDGTTDLSETGSGNDQIQFAPDLSGTLNLTLGQMQITQSLTITGRGAENTIIDAQQNSRIFDISSTAGDVTLDGVCLRNGQTTGWEDGGGAVRALSSGLLRVVNSTLSGNLTRGYSAYGGAINANNVEISDSLLENNQTHGDSYTYGGAVRAETLIVNRSRFNDNSTSGYGAQGGAIWASNLTVSDSSFDGNATTGGGYAHGGAVSASTATITDSTFDGNSTKGYYGRGGAIRAYTLTITGSRLSDNKTSGYQAGGGAIAADHLTLADCSLTSNSTRGANADGGAVWSADMTVQNSTLSGNTATGAGARGGALAGYGRRAGWSWDSRSYSRFYPANVTVLDSRLTNNSAPNGHGGAINVDGNLTLTGSTLSGNSTGGNGGAIRASDLQVKSSMILENQAQRGGAIAAEASDFGSGSVTITNSIVSRNVSRDTTADRNFFHSAALIVSDCLIDDPRIGDHPNLVFGTIWNDFNGDGLRGAGDSGLAGWTVFLDENSDGVADPTEPSTTTDSQGIYVFFDVAAGPHTVCEILPDGWLASLGYPTSRVVSVINGGAVVHFANFLPKLGSIGGTVWSDLNGDGYRAAIDSGLAEWQVYVDQNNDGVLNPGEPVATTDADGKYTITGVSYGSIILREVIDPRFRPTAPASATYSFKLLNGQDVTGFDFGNCERGPGSVSGLVWSDLDGNGYRNGSYLNRVLTYDPGLVGWQVYVDQNNDGELNSGEPVATTDANGNYTITGVPIGLVTIREVVDPRYRLTGPKSASYSFELLDGQDVAGYDFMNLEPRSGSISGTVWSDLNGDGSGWYEPGLAGWQVYVDQNNDGVLNPGEPFATTDVAGKYTITGIPQGSGTIREVVDPRFQPTNPTSASRSFYLLNGQDIALDFGNCEPRPGSVSGKVWDDSNGDGRRDYSERGLAGWQVYVDQNNDRQLNPGEPVATTDSDGKYTISGLSFGRVTIREVVDPRFRQTSYTENYNRFLYNGENATGFDFTNCERGPGSISGFVWSDLNGNGWRDSSGYGWWSTEPGLAGWQVYVDQNNDRVLNPGEPVATSNSNGEYTILGVPPGSVTVREVVDPRFRPTAPTSASYTFNLLDGQDVNGYNFGNCEPRLGSVSGTVWSDLNGNGYREWLASESRWSEPGLAGWRVYLDQNNDGMLNPGEPVATTDTDGKYTFTGISQGLVTIREVVDPTFRVTAPYLARHSFNLLNGQNATGFDFGNCEPRPGSISGTVWSDLDGDGVRRDEPGLAGWQVFADQNNDGVLNPGEPVATSEPDGKYTITGIPQGSFWIREVVDPGFRPSYPNDASRWVYLLNGQNVEGYDFGNCQREPGSISGTVWNDLNGNGDRDTVVRDDHWVFVELGLPGWQVYIDQNNDGALNPGEPTATTDADGKYTISEVPAGSVTIREVVDPDFRTTAPTNASRSLTLLDGQDVRGYDFGNFERNDASISGTLFVDANRNGERDSDEQGFAGITVFIDLNGNGKLDVGEPQAVTLGDSPYTTSVNESGNYKFLGLRKGTYVVRQIVPDQFSSTPDSERAHTVTIAAGEARGGIDFADVFRPCEIHGLVFDDQNRNHVQDTDERGLRGWTMYLDLNRDNVFQIDEPTTVTAADGSYSFTNLTFTNLTPGAYVVREVVPASATQTFPFTGSSDGVLLPDGISHAALGSVSAVSINGAPALGATLSQTVSLAIPDSGVATNLVDIFLLLDDTGSFSSNSPIVRSAFSQIITTMTSSSPAIDFGFGVARFEEYANFAGEYETGRPFVLNSPIIAASTPGFSSAIQAAIVRWAPGFGGDGPETVIEALFQTATGRGFDGNNNGTVTDSGSAGLGSTQLRSGSSGDVPAFSSYTIDPTGAQLAAAGSIGGAGFRPGALPIILVATDTGFAYQPKDESLIVGAGGVTLPVAALTQGSRGSSPNNLGAGIQETITALNSLGALVIGLGTNAVYFSAPGSSLSALAKLTGAINRSSSSIANGTSTPIAPGDPLYFPITSSGLGPTVAGGIASAIDSSTTVGPLNITIRASDSSVRLVNRTGTVSDVGVGQTATFDLEFTGDGRPHRFDLQFVRAGTNAVLGSIPVVLGTPISGDGYQFVDLADGQISTGVDFGNYVVRPPNVAPQFVAGADQSALEDSGVQVVNAWATSIRPGLAIESSQSVNFVVTNDNAALFSSAPAIAPDGTLTYTPAPNANGVATVSVQLQDNGGTADGGRDTSELRTFTITVNAANDAPGASSGSLATAEDTPTTGTLSANDIDSPSLTFSLVDTTNAHGTVTITNAATGAFSYSPDLNFNGSASFTFKANDGSLDSNIGTVSLTVNGVNDAPVASNGSLTTAEDSAVTGTLLSSDIDSPLLAFSLVDTANAHGIVTITNAATGAYSYTPTANHSGPASFTFKVNDGSLNSNIGTVSITVTPMPTRDLVYTATGSSVLAVTVVSGRMQVKIGSATQPTINPAIVRTITLNGGTSRDSVNLSTLSMALYTHLVGITINGGNGSDSLTGGPVPNTINGGHGNNVITGGAGDDTLLGGSGSDTISGLAGDDEIDAGLGTDSVLGGDGNDDIHGGAGKDTLNGGVGSDCLHGDTDNDKLLGGAGNDTLRGGLGDDSLNGGIDNDLLWGEDDKDTLLGGLGADILLGGLGDDSLNGNGSVVTAGDGNDTLLGGLGRDYLKGGTGNDALSGDDGNDTLAGEAGTDTLFGGLGTDTLLTGESNRQDGGFNDAAFLLNLDRLLAQCP